MRKTRALKGLALAKTHDFREEFDAYYALLKFNQV